MRQGLVPTKALGAHRVSLDEAPGAFPDWIRPETGAIKAPIEI
jgi:hypothetical protein